jgi:hypothetical protein
VGSASSTCGGNEVAGLLIGFGDHKVQPVAIAAKIAAPKRIRRLMFIAKQTAINHYRRFSIETAAAPWARSRRNGHPGISAIDNLRRRRGHRESVEMNALVSFGCRSDRDQIPGSIGFGPE